MNEAELRERIRRWEDLHTELKGSLIHPDKLAAELVAFANTDGGQLIIGVDEAERRIVGVEDVDGALRQVDNVAYNNCVPGVTVVQETIPTSEGPVVVVNVPKGDSRPYRTRQNVYYIRTTSGKRPASQGELLRLFQAAGSLYYDELPVPTTALTDLDFDAFELFLEDTGQGALLGPDAGADEKRTLLHNWRLITQDHLTLAGLVLFGRHPQRHLPFAQINAARFPGTDSSYEPSDRKDCRGRLLDVIDQAVRFVDLHLPTPHRIRGLEPEPRPELPREVLREAVVNAVVHRDYTIHGPIRIFVFDDRIDVHTPGRPPNGVDAGAMRAGVHVPRNPTLYARVADAGLVTRAGTGIRRMSRLAREATGRDLGLEVRDFEVLLSLPRKTRAGDDDGPAE